MEHLNVEIYDKPTVSLRFRRNILNNIDSQLNLNSSHDTDLYVHKKLKKQYDNVRTSNGVGKFISNFESLESQIQI